MYCCCWRCRIRKSSLRNFRASVFASAVEEEPEKSGREIYEVNVREFSVRAFGDGIEIADEREQHGQAREPRKNLRPGSERSVVAQITRQRDADQRVGHDETVGGERAEPAVNVQAACAARRQHDYRQSRGDSGNDHCVAGSFVARVCGAQRAVRQAVVRHQQQDARGGGDARECSGEHADQRADINQQSKQRNAAYGCDYVHWRGARAQILAGSAEAENFGVGANGEECAADDGGLNHCTRNCFQRIARFGAQRGGAFEADEAEERQHQAEPQAAAGHAAQFQLFPIEMQAVAHQN